MTMQTAPQVMPEMIVDRSPELARGAPEWVAGGDKILTLTAEGSRGDGSACALARVFEAAYPDMAEAHIEGEHPYVVAKGGRRVELTMTRDVAEWIGRFDRGEPVEPMQICIGLA